MVEKRKEPFGQGPTKNDIVVWHDLINNSISSHKSIKYRLSSVQELTKYLTTDDNNFKALVYCQRTGTSDIFEELLSTGILVLLVTKHLISKRKRKTQLGDYSVLHQEPAHEIKSLDEGNLKVLKKKKNLGKQQRKARAKVRLVERAENKSASVLEQAFVMCEILLQPWLKYILRHNNCLKQFLNVVKSSNKLVNRKYRLHFLKNCNNNNDIIPDFLKFRIPKKKVFFFKTSSALLSA